MYYKEKYLFRHPENPIIAPRNVEDAYATFNCGQTMYKELMVINMNDILRYALTKEPYTFRSLTTDEIPSALSLAWEVFSKYESPVYSEEGTEEFYKCLHDEKYLLGITYYGAFDKKTLIGEIGIRPKERHICFFFVKGSYHRKGIGTKLFGQLLRDIPYGTVTLNSSPYGLPFYKALGFVPTDNEQIVNGIRFTPMKCR